MCVRDSACVSERECVKVRESARASACREGEESLAPSRQNAWKKEWEVDKVQILHARLFESVRSK